MMLIPLTALLLIIVPIAFNATFFLLQRSFSYPDILRQSPETILRRLHSIPFIATRVWRSASILASCSPVHGQFYYVSLSSRLDWSIQLLVGWE